MEFVEDPAKFVLEYIKFVYCITIYYLVVVFKICGKYCTAFSCSIGEKSSCITYHHRHGIGLWMGAFYQSLFGT